MSVFTKYAMDTLMKASHPEIDRKQCWNLTPHKDHCTDCKDICPYGDKIFIRPNLIRDWAACTDCGLCVSACRSRCIQPSAEQVQQDIAPADSDNDTVWIGCTKSGRRNDLVRSCICALSWEAMAYIALNRKVVLDLTPCGECENDLCAEKLRSELTRLVEFFGPALFQSRFTLAYQPGEAPYEVKNLSRREMFSHMTDSSKAGSRYLLRLLPGVQDAEQGKGLDFRLLLNQRIKQLKSETETPARYGFYLPAVTSKCYGCGKCEKACRAGALKIEDLPEGLSRVVITPWKCSECGACAAACRDHAIDGMVLRQLTSLGPVSVLKFKKSVCTQCGKPTPPDSPDGLCSVCRIRARSKKRQQEAAERARARAAERAAQKAAQEAQTAAAQTAVPPDDAAPAASAESHTGSSC